MYCSRLLKGAMFITQSVQTLHNSAQAHKIFRNREAPKKRCKGTVLYYIKDYRFRQNFNFYTILFETKCIIRVP